MYVLAKEFGLSAREVLYERETWEIDNLLKQRKRERELNEQARGGTNGQ